MEWGATTALAAIAWTNGVQRVPAGALVLRRVLGGPWAPVAIDSPPAGWHVVGWWAPLTASLVLRGGGADAPASAAAVRRSGRRVCVRLRRARPFLRVLRLLGALDLAGLVLGLPWTATRFGAWGLGGGAAALLLLATVTAVVAAVAIRGTGATWWAAARTALPLLSPFGAPRAADVVLERVVRDTPPELVARALLPRQTFVSLIRPRAYDATRRQVAEPADDGAELRTLFGAPFLASLVDTPPSGRTRGEAYCPRCEALYHPGVPSCGDCAGVALVLPLDA